MPRSKHDLNLDRPILFIANSSWYLNHYRQLLIQLIASQNKSLILSPVDSSTEKLPNQAIHIPWNLTRAQDSKIFSLGISLLRATLLVRALKPRLIHSHTLKANLITAFVSCLFDIPCVLSFAGLGRGIQKSGLKAYIYKSALKVILNLASHRRSKKFGLSKTDTRTVAIAQNPNDKIILEGLSNKSLSIRFCLIPGSGVPSQYRSADPSKWLSDSFFDNENYQLIYCARLLKSKGILEFCKLSAVTSASSSYIFGAIDKASADSLSNEDLEFLKEKYPKINIQGVQCDPLLQLTNSWSILVVPSSYGEGFPRAIVEAQALGIPVVCSKQAASGIFDDRTTYICETNTVQEYSELITKVTKDHNEGRLRKKLIKARSIALTQYSEELIAEKTIDLYRDITSTHRESYYIDKLNPSKANLIAS